MGSGVVQVPQGRYPGNCAVAVPWEWYFGGTVGVVLRRHRGVDTVGGEGGTMGGGVVQVVAVPWGWYFDDTGGLVPWRWKAVPWEVVLCKYLEGGTVRSALSRYRGDGTSAVPWGWYRGWGGRCLGG